MPNGDALSYFRQPSNAEPRLDCRGSACLEPRKVVSVERKNASKLPRFVGVRLEADAERKLLEFSRAAGKPGNMSAGLRWALDQCEIRQSPEPSATPHATEELALA